MSTEVKNGSVMAESGWQKYLDLATGFTDVTRRSAEGVVRGLVKQGEVAADATERAVDELLQRSEQNRRLIVELVRAETQRAVSALGLASQSEIEALQAKVARLESAPTAAGPPSAPAAKKAAPAAKKAAPARKAAAEDSSGGEPTPSARKSGGKKSTSAKKSGGKKSTASATPKKTAARTTATEATDVDADG